MVVNAAARSVRKENGENGMRLFCIRGNKIPHESVSINEDTPRAHKAGKKLRKTQHASARCGEIRKWLTSKQSHL